MGLLLLSTMKDSKHQEVLDPPQTALAASKHIMWQYMLGIFVLYASSLAP